MTATQTGGSEYDARIRRAEHLASQHPFAAEVLRFYSRIAEFQKNLYAEFKKDFGAQLSGRMPGSLRIDLPSVEPERLVSHFTSLLRTIEQAGPPALAATAREISGLDALSKLSLLESYWDVGGTNDQLIGAFAQFIPRAFDQPLAELIAAFTPVGPVFSTQHRCPLCGGLPLLGVLRQEWDFRRIYCPACGEEDEKKLPVYVAEQFPHIRVEACETCKVYVRTIDLTKDGNAVPVVDDLAAIPLSLWAHERGYTRPQPNLLGT